MIRSYIKYIVCIGIMVGVTACGGDSSTGPDSSKAPQTPELEKAQPDISFFEDNQPQSTNGKLKKGSSAYSSAYMTAFNGAFYTAIGSIYTGLFAQGDDENANYNNGTWDWSYTYSYAGVQAEWRRTAKELSNGSIKWNLFYSFDDGETSIQDYNMIEGTVSDDGSSGDWTFNSNNPDSNTEVPLIKSEWAYTDDSNGTLNIKIYDDGSISDTIDYEQSGNVYTMTFSTGSGTTDIGWNTDTNVGFYDDGNGRTCWDENFDDASCSSVGL